MDRLSWTRKTAGFTLMEVLIALAILAIALTAVVESTSSSIVGFERVRDKLSAHWVAMNVIASMQAGLIPFPEKEQATGSEKMLRKTWQWRASLSQASAQNSDFERVTVAVFTQGKQVAHIEGFLQKPQVRSKEVSQ